MGTAITLALISSLLLMGIYLHFSQSLLLLFGGGVNEQTLEFSREYFFIIMLGIPFYMFSQAVNPMIRADGSPQFAMISTLAGALLNVILDPLFIFGFEMGMTGAALATILGQILSSALCLFYLRKPQLIVLSWKDLKPESKMTGKILEYGLTSFLSQISLVAAMAAINSMLLKYGALDPVYSQPALAQIPMAVVGIVMKIFQIVISIVVGMAAGCIPIVGFNMGAKKTDRVRKLLILLLFWEAAAGFIALLLAELFPGQLIGVFGASVESHYYTDFAVRSFRIYLCMLPLACINKASFIFLQAMGKPKESILLSMVREIVFGVGFALLLPKFFGLNGILYSMPVSDLLTGILSIAVLVQITKQLKSTVKEQPGCLPEQSSLLS